MTKAESKLAVAAAHELIKGNPDGLREIMRAVLQEILEAEMTDALGAAKSERTIGRLGYRAGYDGRTLITRVGKLELRVPQDRWSGSGKEWSGRLPLRADMVALTAAAVAISMA